MRRGRRDRSHPPSRAASRKELGKARRTGPPQKEEEEEEEEGGGAFEQRKPREMLR